MKRVISNIVQLVVAGVAIAGFFFFTGVSHTLGQEEKDPHRPACNSPQCRRIESFLKAHYCGESPFGNGPDDGCDIRLPKELNPKVDVRADFRCEWVDGKESCHQQGQPSAEVRRILASEMRRLGLRASQDNQTYFTVWKLRSSGRIVAEAFYAHAVGPSLALCQVIAIIDPDSRVHVLRQLPFQKTNPYVPTVTTWTLLDLANMDLADTDQGEDFDVILESDTYEDHWFEVVRVQDEKYRAIFSGLGYCL